MKTKINLYIGFILLGLLMISIIGMYLKPMLIFFMAFCVYSIINIIYLIIKNIIALFK